MDVQCFELQSFVRVSPGVLPAFQDRAARFKSCRHRTMESIRRHVVFHDPRDVHESIPSLERRRSDDLMILRAG